MRLRSHVACRAGVNTFQLSCNPVEFIQWTLVEIPGSIVPLHAFGEGVTTWHDKPFWLLEDLDFVFVFFSFDLWFRSYNAVRFQMCI